ncbi:MAG: hypothetical protein R3184_11835, partial [Aurantimonas coralicida]|nr:hypothetical protein [Aurantimonas coralicida]
MPPAYRLFLLMSGRQTPHSTSGTGSGHSVPGSIAPFLSSCLLLPAVLRPTQAASRSCGSTLSVALRETMRPSSAM